MPPKFNVFIELFNYALFFRPQVARSNKCNIIKFYNNFFLRILTILMNHEQIISKFEILFFVNNLSR